MALHLVVGAGPVGSTTARLLADRGNAVKLATRSGGGPSHPGIELVRLDASDVDALSEAAAGAAAVYNCVNPPYASWPTLWPTLAEAFLGAAEHTGAALVTMGNLYAYGPVPGGRMTEDLPPASNETKGRVRARMWEQTLAAQQAGRVRVAEVRASDFFGPEVKNSHVGERFVPRILAGKGVRMVGDPSQPHSWTYMPDVAATLARVGTGGDGWGRPWHVPTLAAMPAIELARRVATTAGAPTPRVTGMPDVALRLAGLAVPMLRELRAMSYQFDRPFVLDSTVTEKALGLHATPLEAQLRATVAWWQERDAGQEAVAA